MSATSAINLTKTANLFTLRCAEDVPSLLSAEAILYSSCDAMLWVVTSFTTAKAQPSSCLAFQSHVLMAVMTTLSPAKGCREGSVSSARKALPAALNKGPPPVTEARCSKTRSTKATPHTSLRASCSARAPCDAFKPDRGVCSNR